MTVTSPVQAHARNCEEGNTSELMNAWLSNLIDLLNKLTRTSMRQHKHKELLRSAGRRAPLLDIVPSRAACCTPPRVLLALGLLLTLSTSASAATVNHSPTHHHVTASYRQGVISGFAVPSWAYAAPRPAVGGGAHVRGIDVGHVGQFGSGADASYCAQRWAYYDKASGMYMGDDGEWRPCEGPGGG
jgi:hypothetical protein